MTELSVHFVSEDQVFWDVIPCQLVDSYQGFGASCCLHLEGLADQEEYLYQKMWVFFTGEDDWGGKPTGMVVFF
jgi:hypothetical protein